ncbi:MAG TPA: hypothetical protein VGH28_10485 [Polyangiaceae bacterium]
MGSQLVATESGHAWPDPTYRDNPVGFARDVLGIEPWSAQRAMLEAIASHDRVCVRSGHRVGKTDTDAMVALWWFATRPRSRVVLLAPSFAQVKEAVWRSVRLAYSSAKVPLGGKIAQLPQTGLHDLDGRQVFGISPDDEFRLQGLACPALLFIVDEASIVEDPIYEVILSNLAGGEEGIGEARMLLTGNPNRNKGYFFDAFRSDRWKQLHIPSTESPNVTGECRVPGLATADWIRDRMVDWGGPNGPIYRIRVLGEFVELTEGRLFSLDMIAAAERAWSTAPATGRLFIGLDPAGSSGKGDESVFCPRRGQKAFAFIAHRGLTADEHVVETLSVITRYRGDSREPPLVVVDRDGIVGADVFASLRAYQKRHEQDFELIGFRGSERATRRPNDVHRRRDEMWFGLVEWMKAGGTIPTDGKVEGELAEIATDQTFRGLAKIIEKDLIRSALGRSPDRADALALSTYVPTMYERDDGDTKRDDEDDDMPPARPMSPWDGGLDPYGGDS